MTSPQPAPGPGGARAALAFLTVLGGAAPPTPSALPWFGPVGIAIGAIVGLVWWSASEWWTVAVAAALALTADAALTGLLHLDGLADSADALLPPVGRDRRLEILRDPRSGAFAVVGVGLVLLLRFAALSAGAPGPRSIAALASIWCTARVAMAVAAVTVPYARSSGLASAFTGARVAPIVAVGAPLALVTAVVGHDLWLIGVLASTATAIGAAAVVTFGRARLGGYTGDVLGAAGVIGETVGLLVLVVHP